MIKFNRKNKFDINIDSSIAGISRQTMEAIIQEWYQSDNAPPDIAADLPKDDANKVLDLMHECIKVEGGEISKHAKIVHLALIYINLNEQGKGRFLRLIARKMDVDTNLLNSRINELKDADNEQDRINAELNLRI